MFLIFLLQLLLLVVQPSNAHVWPACAVAQYSNETLHLLLPTESWKFTYTGLWRPARVTLKAARRRFLRALQNKLIAAASHENHFTAQEHPTDYTRSVSVDINITTPNTLLQHNVDESYNLVIPFVEGRSLAQLNVQLVAPTVYGAMHGLQTLLQLVEVAEPDFHESNGRIGLDRTNSRGKQDVEEQYIQALWRIRCTPIFIHDAPTYPYRGLLIDTSRHYLPVDTIILPTLSAMAMNKLNVLHWHLTDSQSWPFASELYPELAQKGAYCKKCVYSIHQVEAVVQAAALYGIRVILEVDMPGHSQSIGASRPELLTLCNDESSEQATPSEPLDVTEPKVYEFVQNLYDELVSITTDQMIHIGGDEVSLECWKRSAKVQTWMKQHNVSDERELWARFETFLLNFTTYDLKKVPIVWQDVLESGFLQLPPGTIVDVWKEWMPESRSMISATHKILFSSCWYLDHLDKDWMYMYLCDPRDFNGTETQKNNVIGGHASMWGERVDETNFVARVWPRASAVAEQLWTGNSSFAFKTAMQRIEHFRCLMLEQGIAASPTWTGSCRNERYVFLDGIEVK